MWGHQALIAFQMAFFRVAHENLRTTNQLLEAIGMDEQMQIHSSGGEIPLSKLVDGKTLMFLQRYKHLLDNGAKALSADQLKWQTLDPISKLQNSQHEHVTGSLGGEGDTTFAEIDEKLQQMTEDEKRKLDKEIKEKLMKALTELKRRREKKQRRTGLREKEKKKTGESKTYQSLHLSWLSVC